MPIIDSMPQWAAHSMMYCPPTMRESDWVLPLDKVQPYLYWIRERFDAGLDNHEIATIATIAHQLYVGESTEYSCQVIHEEKSATLKFGLMMSQPGLLTIELCTSPELSEALDWTIQSFYDDLV